MKNFQAELKQLKYVIDGAASILLVAHSRPDPDSVGANAALYFYLTALGKRVSVVCSDPLPEKLTPLFTAPALPVFHLPTDVDVQSYDVVMAADSVDRGFDTWRSTLREDQIVVLIDHHPDIDMPADITLIDTEHSSSSEIVYEYFEQHQIPITLPVATALLMGIVFDTGNFKHTNVTPRVMRVGVELMKLGAPLAQIGNVLFAQTRVGGVKLWGRALERARYFPTTGMVVTAITTRDLRECDAEADDIYQLTSTLATIPECQYSLVLSEQEGGIVRGSLRSGDAYETNVSAIAKQLGGGGHVRASGFEISGRLVVDGGDFRIEDTAAVRSSN
jgi:phosphoesterase RecJ-like protein